MTQSLRILHLIPELNHTCGISKTIFNIISGTKDAFEHQIFTLSGDAIEYFTTSQIRVNTFNSSRKNLFGTIRILFSIIQIVRKESIRIIHSHHRYFDFLSFLISKFYNVKTITTVHSIVRGLKFISYKSNKLIVVSEAVRQHLIHYFMVDFNRISLINNFIIPENIIINKDSDELRKELNIHPSEDVILFIGRIDKEKGIDILVQAFNLVSSKVKGCTLVMVGSGPMNLSIERFIIKNKLNIQLIPPVANPFNLYNMADVVILPSRVDPFPLTMLEAGFCKKPFIGTAIDGIAEFITDKEDGILVESENIVAFSNAIQVLIDNKELRNRYGLKLHQNVIRNYTLQNKLPKYKSLYLSLIK